MNSEPLLSICIATYNRGEFISQTLDSLLPQLADDAEIVVVDGGSTDSTAQILEAFARKTPKIRNVFLKTKGGVDQDFNLAAESAAGRYCWLLPDDDLIEPDAVQSIRDALRREPSLVVINAEVWNADISQSLESTRLSLSTEKFFPPSEHEELFLETINHLSYIGAIVVLRSLWIAREKRKYFSSEFAHIGVLFQEPLPGGTVVLPKPLIKIRYGVAQWTSRTFQIWVFKWPWIIWSLENLSPEVRNRITPKFAWKSSKTLLLERAKGTYSKQEYDALILPECAGPWEKMLPRIIASLPGRLVNALVYFYFYIFWRKLGIILYDLRRSRYFSFSIKP